MKILLTGPNGFSGNVILRRLVNNGYDMTAISRQISDQNQLDNVSYIYGDLSKIEQLDGDFDAIVHTSARSPVEGTAASVLIQDNILATENLIRLAQNCNIKKFIFFSTCSVYGESSQISVNENTPIENPSFYGTCKLAGEAMLRDQKKFKTIVIRFPAILGKGATKHWLANTVNKAVLGEDIVIYNPYAIFNNAIHVHQVAEFVDQLLCAKFSRDFDCMNVASREGLSIGDIVDTIIKKLNSTSKIIIKDRKQTSFSISAQYAIDNYAFKPQAFSDALNLYLSEC